MSCSAISCGSIRAWSITHPKTVGLSIALIFALGAILAYYGLHSSMYWPIGIGATGLALSLFVMGALKKMGNRPQPQDPGPAGKSFLESITTGYGLIAFQQLQANTLVVHARDNQGNNALHLAVTHATENVSWSALIAAILVYQPSFKQARNDNGETPIDLAKKNPNAYVLQALQQHKDK